MLREAEPVLVADRFPALLDALLDPHPTENFRRLDPQGDQKVKTRLWFLLVRV